MGRKELVKDERERDREIDREIERERDIEIERDRDRERERKKKTVGGIYIGYPLCHTPPPLCVSIGLHTINIITCTT